MTRMIFVNLPVSDLAKSTAFYEAVGATKNPQFSDDTASGMVFSDTINVMLLTHAKWASFTDRAIPDATRTAQVALCLSLEDRAEVDAFLSAGAAAGGEADVNPPQDHGFMYSRSLADPDGHIWEPMFFDMAVFAEQAAAAPERQPA